MKDTPITPTPIACLLNSLLRTHDFSRFNGSLEKKYLPKEMEFFFQLKNTWI